MKQKNTNGYIGQIPNSGVAVVNAPNAKKTSGGKSVVKKGKDLRTGK